MAYASGNIMKSIEQTGLRTAIGGTLAFIVVMGIGRFAFTAILPDMMNSYGFGEDTAGVMAAWNYAGYLAGVLLMRGVTSGKRRFDLFIIFLVASLITTAGMGLTAVPHLLHGIRFVAGVASGACFVLCSSIVLDTLTALNRPVLAGVFYSGVGMGIALGGLTAGPLAAAGGPEGAWFGLAGLCLPLACISLLFLRASPGNSLARTASFSAPPAKPKGQTKKYRLLLTAYFLEGFGYIIGATFLVTLVQNTTNSPDIARASWIATGCAAALSAPLWRLAARKGYLPMLILAFVLQGIGALLPVVSNSIVAALGGGLLLGGTFMGITVLSLQYGVQLSGKPSAYTVAVMTALYGIGQIIGPIVAGGQGFYTAFIVSAASLFVGAVFLAAASFVNANQ